MGSYYFTLASLPSLESGANLPGPEQFLEMASMEVNPEGLERLGRVLQNKETEDPFVRRYRAFDRRLRYEIARLRAQALSWPQPEVAEMSDEFLADWARQVYQQETPLQAEEVLDGIRDSWLVRAAFGKDYEWEHLVSYALRLGLWWKRKNREIGRGRQHFEDNYRIITQNRGVEAP